MLLYSANFCFDMAYREKEIFTLGDFDYAAAKPGVYVEEAVVDAAMDCLHK